MSTTNPNPRITRNFVRGPQVRTTRGLSNLAGTRKAVYHRGWHRIIPAGIIVNMQFKLVIEMIAKNYIFEIRHRPLPNGRPWKNKRKPTKEIGFIGSPDHSHVTDAKFEF